ncbi:TetR/AcrR family transcriptional regulator [Levilactobacillus zymae]|uniref:TetR/AcrR family transcriptional regulator n=1 Tax=Levilactobacillus zymae TaxID=267363 RepID=UPI0028BBA28D|nr:TetR/AcrR family transcriptional regulator [Levilactobacillus zymae]MDT6979697.1 TetR/AcrR family transcriptional regulator [Levilactobacillus zymae]
MVDKDERRIAMVMAAQEYIIIHGLRGLKIDVLAQAMGVSRAKLYQYFGSKTGVIQAVVAYYTDFIDQLELPATGAAPTAFSQRFFDFFFEDMAYLGTTTPQLLSGLRAEYPELFLALNERLQTREQQERAYIQAGQAAGVFRAELLPDLVLLQNQRLIPAMVTREFRFKSRAQLPMIIRGYFDQLVATLLREPHQAAAKASWDGQRIQRINQKYARISLQAT